MEYGLGQILAFGGNFAPRGFAYCDGQLMSINANQALFSILGTTYGGDGRTTFALPDLRGRTPVGQGHGAGLSYRKLGQRSGLEYNILNQNNLPSHTHSADITSLTITPFVRVSSDEAEEVSPEAQNLAALPTGTKSYNTAGTAGQKLGGTAAGLSGSLQLANQGGSQPLYNMQPWEAIHYIITLVGLFPSRN